MRGLTAAALPPTARVANMPVAAATVVFAAIPALVTVVRGGNPSTGVTILVLGAAVSVAFAVDDPSANVLASKPISTSQRRALRFLVVGFLIATLTGAIMAIVAAGPGLPDDLTALIAPASAAATVAIFTALFAFEREDRGSGITGVIGGLLVVGLTMGLAVRWPRVFPSMIEGPIHDRWWLLTAMAAFGAWRVGRDPSVR